MPDKSATVVTYAAGASLAAAALIYVFGPTFTIDHQDGMNSRKKTIVGLRNQANDCFINSVLQALAGLGELRVYLIRETHRRRIQDPAVCANAVQPTTTTATTTTTTTTTTTKTTTTTCPQDGSGGGGGGEMPQWKLQGLQQGLVTQGLKDMLDSLNQRPITKKAISPFPFVRVLELAFKQRISRQQQDAQEFLQIVAERLKDEYHAGQKARLHARNRGNNNGAGSTTDSNEAQNDAEKDGKQAMAHHATPTTEPTTTTTTTTTNGTHSNGTSSQSISETDSLLPRPALQTDCSPPILPDDGFPMEGKYESQIQCQTCGYKTKPREETFCTITLAVPQVMATSLSSCFDGIFKTEYIDDFKCEKCRLVHTVANLEHEMLRSTSATFKANALDSIARLKEAIRQDPEKPPEGVHLGDMRYAPKRRIAKTTRMTIFPKILAIHLSRSIYGIGQTTQKNSAKVAFPEQLPLGGLASQHHYKLIGTVTHRGGHNSGHYEAFRRQNAPPHYPNSNTFMQSDFYSQKTTPLSTPVIRAENADLCTDTDSLTTDLPPPTSTAASAPYLAESAQAQSWRGGGLSPTGTAAENNNGSINGRDRDTDTSSLRSVAASTKSALSRLATGSGSKTWSPGLGPPSQQQQQGQEQEQEQQAPSLSISGSIRRVKSKRAKQHLDRWWRVSDEKVREAKTGEVLGMQKEVYLLFYELEK